MIFHKARFIIISIFCELKIKLNNFVIEIVAYGRLHIDTYVLLQHALMSYGGYFRKQGEGIPILYKS